jgi:hypothetical protein
MAREPLTQSAAIDTPDRSQAMAQAMGNPGDGFGTAPLDANRIFMNPDFYKKFLRRSTMTQEASDEATAFSNLITGEDFVPPTQGSFSMATLKGQERQNRVEIAAEGLASRLEAIRERQNRIKKALPKPVVGAKILEKLYNNKSKKGGQSVLYSPETIDSLNPLQLVVAINESSARLYSNGDASTKKLTDELKKYSWGTAAEPSATWIEDLRSVAYAMNRGDQNIRIPFVSATLSDVKAKDYIEVLNAIKQGAVPNLKKDIEDNIEFLREVDDDEINFTEGGELISLARGRSKGRATSRKAKRSQPEEPPGPPVYLNAIRGVIEGKRKKAVSDALSGIVDTIESKNYKPYENMTFKELQDELRSRGLFVSGRNKAELILRLKN